MSGRFRHVSNILSATTSPNISPMKKAPLPDVKCLLVSATNLLEKLSDLSPRKVTQKRCYDEADDSLGDSPYLHLSFPTPFALAGSPRRQRRLGIGRRVDPSDLFVDIVEAANGDSSPDEAQV